MAQAPAAVFKIPAQSPQPAPGKSSARPKRQAKPGAPRPRSHGMTLGDKNPAVVPPKRLAAWRLEHTPA